MKTLSNFLFIFFLSSCANHEVKKVKIVRWFIHPELGQITELDDRFVVAESDCKHKYRTEIVLDNSQEKLTRLEWDMAMANAIQNNKGGPAVDVSMKYFEQEYLENCVKEIYRFAKQGVKRVDADTGKDVVYKHSIRWYIPKDDM